MIIDTPELFNFDECLNHLGRSKLETTYQVKGKSVIKAFETENKRVLVKIEMDTGNRILVDFGDSNPSGSFQSYIGGYVTEWFDLEAPLEDFYAFAKGDPLLKDLTNRYRGLRIIKIPDLFEALSWSIIGQQINLGFAYQVRKNLINYCDNYYEENGHRHYFFPKPKEVLEISHEVLRQMKFSKQKSDYIKYAAEAVQTGRLNKNELKSLGSTNAKEKLTALKGIGNWSANYVMMRCLGFSDALPIADAGLHNAFKKYYKMDRKPTIPEIEKWTANWNEWAAYGTNYLWRSLND